MKKIKRALVGLVMFCVLAVCICFNMTNAYAKSSVGLNKTKVNLYVGNTYKLKLNGVTTGTVKWSTSSKTIAKVSTSGKVTALKKGTALIRANYKGDVYTCKLTVKRAKLKTNNLTLQIGQGYVLEVLHSQGKISWKSNNESVANINKNGYISPQTIGSTKITAKIGNEVYICKLSVVARFSETDFVFDTPDDEGYTNFVDFHTNKPSWYYYYDDATNKYVCNRDINIGDTYGDVVAAYGQCDTEEIVSSYDTYKKHFNNAAYPRTKMTYTYKDELTQIHYYKTFYFDRNGTLVLIIWHV